MEKIQKIIKEFFQIIGIDNIKVEIKKDSSLKDKELLRADVEISSEQAEPFIKEGAVGLSALQHLLRILISKQILTPNFFVLDVNEYKKQREKLLDELVLKTVEKVRKIKKPISLEPMPAYERRLVHLKLAEHKDIVTESVGEEPERKVVVRLYP
jgi:spoIIIJ-associated protein